jgi:predicted RNase H-like HicB family nuclease
MLLYHAAYYQIEDGWYMAEVLDFPGALSQGRTLKSARRMIRDALRGLAECLLEEGKALPRPNPRARDKSAAFLETIPLTVRATTGAMPETATAAGVSARPRPHRGARSTTKGAGRLAGSLVKGDNHAG